MNDVYNMSAQSRREKHKQELRAVILDAAREIFVQEGYESFTMRKLAKKIEYSPGSIYLHFQNKQELFECLVEESFARLLKMLMRLKNGTEQNNTVEELKKGLHLYVEFGLRNPSDYRFAFMLRPPAEKRPYKVHGAFDAMRYMVRRCVEEKQFRAVDVETTSQALWATVHGITSLLIQRPSFPWVRKKELVAQVINSAVDSLVAGPSTMVGTGENYASISRV